jgi:hypothetical protein
VPQPAGKRTQSTDVDKVLRAIEAARAELVQQLEDDPFGTAMKLQGFTKTLKSLNKGREPTTGEMMTVHEGVIEELPSGGYDASLHTDKGHVLLQSAERADHTAADPQLIASRTSQPYDTTVNSSELTADQLLRQLSDAGANPPSILLCMIELARFDASQQQVLLPLLWEYILEHRNSNDSDELIAVGAAIRKYIAIMPMNRMGELAVLLESGNRSPLSIDLEIEVVKMIYRNFEVHPPVVADPHPELAQRLWEMVQAYINPRVLLREKHAAATSLAIEAIVSMRSSLAEQAWQAAVACPFHWFAELVSDDLDDLIERWRSKHPEAATWLCQLRDKVLACT